MTADNTTTLCGEKNVWLINACHATAKKNVFFSFTKLSFVRLFKKVFWKHTFHIDIVKQN